MSSLRTFLPTPGREVEKRPRCEAPLARAGCLFLLCLVAFLLLSIPPSLPGATLVIGIRAGFLLALTHNIARGVMLRRLRYGLEPGAFTIHLGIQTLRIPYTNIARVERRDGPWSIKRAGPLTYAKEVPQLIEYVAQIGSFILDGRQKVYLYSTLSSYHHPTGLILITTKDGKQYGISPAEPERFLTELEARRKQVQSA
jgi:hypothetical protein